MSFLYRGRRVDLLILGVDLRLIFPQNAKSDHLIKLVNESKYYGEDFVL